MKVLAVILAVCVSTSRAALCQNSGGDCRPNCNGFGNEFPNFGILGCLGLTGTVCCMPFPTTPEPTTEMTTEAPTTTEPTTEGTTTPQPAPPVEEECGVRMQDDAEFLNARILGGAFAETCSWPWMVSIRGKDGPTANLDTRGTFPFCSGVLVDQQHVLTTADCVMTAGIAGGLADLSNNLLLVAGETDFKSPDIAKDSVQSSEQFHTVESITVHQGFFKPDPTTWVSLDLVNDEREANNFAIIKLKQKMTYNKCVRKICLPELGSTPPFAQDNCKAAGWGVDQANTQLSEFDGRLKDVDISVLSGEQLKTIAPFVGLPPPKALTTQGQFESSQGASTCLGDNGGMVSCQDTTSMKWVLEGLVDRPGFTKCDTTTQVVLGDVRAANQWIRDTIAQNTQSVK